MPTGTCHETFHQLTAGSKVTEKSLNSVSTVPSSMSVCCTLSRTLSMAWVAHALLITCDGSMQYVRVTRTQFKSLIILAAAALYIKNGNCILLVMDSWSYMYLHTHTHTHTCTHTHTDTHTHTQCHTHTCLAKNISSILLSCTMDP